MKLSKCTVTLVSVGPGGLSVKRPCGKPAIRRLGKRKYCSQHLNQERERLHLPWLERGSFITVTHSSGTTKLLLEPQGVAVGPEDFRELATTYDLAPTPGGALFPDMPSQVWKLCRGRRYE